MSKKNPVGWIEFPSLNRNRAKKFYAMIFGIEWEGLDRGPLKTDIFPYDQEAIGTGTSFVQMPQFYKPSTTEGFLRNLTSFSGALQNELHTVESVGGKTIQQKKLIAENIGYRAIMLVAEGNRIGLHSRK